MIEIDGSQGEGGGQIIRTALSLSCVTGRAFRVARIRANRKQPGLKAQHLAGVRAAAQICGAELEGDGMGSQSLSFSPGPPRAGNYRFDIGTAGATSLLLQTIVYPLAAAGVPSTVRLSGGTHVPWSPAFPFLQAVWAWWYERLGGQVKLELERAGFYPKGGGVIRATIGPRQPAGRMSAERGPLERVLLTSQVAGDLPGHILERQVRGAERALGKLPVRSRADRLDSFSPGSLLLACGEYASCRAGCSALGKRGKKAENVGREAAEGWRSFHDSKALLDEHMADQILIPAALGLEPGRRLRFTTERVTGHLLTNAETISLFLPVKISVEGAEGRPGAVALSAT